MEEALTRYAAGLKQQKLLSDRYAFIDPSGLVSYASPRLLKECKLEKELPASHRDLVSQDLYTSRLSDVLYDINTSEKSIAVLKARFEEVQSQGVPAVADRLDVIAKRFAEKKHPETATRVVRMGARFPTEKGHQNYHEKITFVKEHGAYAGALAQFHPVSAGFLPQMVMKMMHLMHIRKQPHELFHVDPAKVTRILSIDNVQLTVDNVLKSRDYLSEYVSAIMNARIEREIKIAKEVQKGIPLEIARGSNMQPQLVLDVREITVNEKTPKRLTTLLCALEDKNRALVIGNASDEVERAYHEAQKELNSASGRDFAFKAVHFRTLTYAFHDYKTIPALEQKIKATLYPDANPISNESVRPDVKDSEGKGLDVLVDSESVEQQP